MKTEYEFLGYLNNEEATLESVDEDGFFKTGDIGYFDSSGELYLVDRNKVPFFVFVFFQLLNGIIIYFDLFESRFSIRK